MVVDTIKGVKSKRVYRVLIDPGSDSTHFWRKRLPKGCVPTNLSKPQGIQVMGSKTSVKSTVSLQHLMFPELSQIMKVEHPFTAYVFDAKHSPYNIILGNDFIVPLGITAQSTTQTITWLD